MVVGLIERVLSVLAKKQLELEQLVGFPVLLEEELLDVEILGKEGKRNGLVEEFVHLGNEFEHIAVHLYFVELDPDFQGLMVLKTGHVKKFHLYPNHF